METLIPFDEIMYFTENGTNEDGVANLNTELDYALAEFYEVTIDMIDSIPLQKVLELRIYMLFQDYDSLNDEFSDCEAYFEDF